MPYPNEHAFRVKSPGDFIDDSFRRKEISEGISIIIGKLKGGSSMVTQAYRFDKGKYSFDEAKKWIKDHNIKTIEQEPAKNEAEPSPAGRTVDAHDRTRPKSEREIFDGVPASSQVPGDGGIHTPQFIKVPRVKESFELDPLWKQTKDVMGVEIFQTGTWKNQEWTDKDLQDAVQNFRDGILGTQPYLTIDHEPQATEEFSKALDGMALGFVKNLYKAGNKLIADFTKVPRIIAELLMAGPLKNKSIELWPEFEAADGTIYKNVLEAVTLTGKVPAVSGLSDVVALFKRETGIAQNERRQKIKLSADSPAGGRKKMNEITIAQDRYEDLLKTEAERKVANDQILNFKNERIDFERKMKDKDDKISELEKFKADTLKADKERLDSKAASFADRLIKTGKILPKSKDFYIEQYKMNKQKSPEMFKSFIEETEGKKVIVPVGEIGVHDTGADGKVSPADGKKVRENFKKDGGSTTAKTYDDAHKMIKSYMEKHNVSYEEAMKRLKLLESPIEAEAEARQKMEAEAEKRRLEAEAEGKAEGKAEEEEGKDGKDGKDDDEMPMHNEAEEE